MSLLRGRGLGLSIVAACLAGTAAPASAQYFGRQKVQYEHLNWRIMKTPHFDVHYYPAELEVTRDAARMAERWYTRHSRTFQHEFDKKPLIFYADHPDFQQTNVINEALGEETGGVTEGLRNRVIMPYTGVYQDNDHVLGHEMVHVFQYDLASSPQGGGLAGFSRLPSWLVEGMAEYLSLGRQDAHTAMWLRDAALRGDLPTIQQLTTGPYFAYRYGQALWAYIAGRWGDRAVPEVFRIATTTGFEEALQRVLGVNSSQLSQDWITSIRSTYLPIIAGRQRPQDVGKRVLYDPEPGAMNISPSVSPDGSKVVFIGRRNLFTPDLILANAATGKTLKVLSSPQRDQHMDAISYIQASGGWSPDGKKFAFVVFRGGNSQLEILDVESTKVEKHISPPGVGAVTDPHWSPDGRRIVFSGMSGGQSDLYILDVATNDVTQLTNDRYADIQPAWSPDGNTIAWVTDRGGTNFDQLTYAPMQIGLMDVATKQIRLLDPFCGAKHINPQWSPDSREIYFISDHEGFSDVYRINVESQQVFQVTRLATGVSGITALSPAISVSRETGLLMFSAFENSGNNIYSLDCAQVCGTVVQAGQEPRVLPAQLLPPLEAAGGGIVSQYLNDPDTGLPESGDFPTTNYSPKISLDYLGPPSFGVGTSNYGAVLAGGVSAFFGDELGDQFIGTAIQANGTLKDIGGQAIYRNASRRLNWGASIGHIPYLTGYSYYDQNPSDPNTLLLNQVLQRIYIDQAAALMYYPFSQTRRLEFSGGVTRYGFNTEIDRAYFDAFTGQQLTNVVRVDTVSPAPITFLETSMAFVGDNSYYGFTSPVSGKRFRFAVTPTLGTLKYGTLLADYRDYIFKKPFTFAFRALHFGRYGPDASGLASNGTQVLSPVFLGYATFVRGYGQNSFNTSECHTTSVQQSSCPVFDRLLGSRIAVANLELRVPLFGVPEFGLINFPYLPTEIAPFIDAGLAWSSGDNVDFTFARNTDARVPVFSAGISARMNILGFLVLETYYAVPFQRPDKGGHIGFQLQPGW